MEMVDVATIISLKIIRTIVLILDGNSEIGVPVWSNYCYLIYLRCSVRSRSVTNRIYSPKRPIFLHECAKCSELPSNISDMGRIMII